MNIVIDIDEMVHIVDEIFYYLDWPWQRWLTNKRSVAGLTVSSTDQRFCTTRLISTSMKDLKEVLSLTLFPCMSLKALKLVAT